MGSVETLICWENLDIQRYVLKNHANSLTTTVLHLTPEQEKDKSHFTDKEVSLTFVHTHTALRSISHKIQIPFFQILISERRRNGISGGTTAFGMAGQQL